MRKTEEQDRNSQGFVHLQMGTNRFANQSGMTGFGMPRHNITKYKDEVRGEMPNDDSTMSRQTSGWREGNKFFYLISRFQIIINDLSIISIDNLII